MKHIGQIAHAIDERLMKLCPEFLRPHAARIREFTHYRAVKLGLGTFWTSRIEDVIASPDNAFIPRVADAGKVTKAGLVMHNGLLISKYSYYGGPVRLMLELNRGVHEPQEERVFGEVLKLIQPGSTILELGAYWAFYSMWFLESIADGNAILVEPDPSRLDSGRHNFAINGFSGTFVNAFVGSEEKAITKTPTVTVDAIARHYSLARIHILHSDIQGAELHMLQGASTCISDGRIDYVFISTHSPKLHLTCTEFLLARGFRIIASADLSETYSADGLIVARASHVTAPDVIGISLKRAGIAPQSVVPPPVA